MKKVLICGVAALVILLAGGTALTKEKGKAGDGRGAKRVADKGISEEQKQWKAKLEAMTPEQRRLAVAKKALEDDLAPWKQVRQIAADEKAVKTMAAIDKIIAEKQEQFNKKMAAAEKRDQPKAEKTKAQNKGPTEQKPARKKKDANK